MIEESLKILLVFQILLIGFISFFLVISLDLLDFVSASFHDSKLEFQSSPQSILAVIKQETFIVFQKFLSHSCKILELKVKDLDILVRFDRKLSLKRILSRQPILRVKTLEMSRCNDVD